MSKDESIQLMFNGSNRQRDELDAKLECAVQKERARSKTSCEPVESEYERNEPDAPPDRYEF